MMNTFIIKILYQHYSTITKGSPQCPLQWPYTMTSSGVGYVIICHMWVGSLQKHNSKAISLTPDPEGGEKNIVALSAGEEACQSLTGLKWPIHSPLLLKALNSPLPSSESICYQIKRLAPDSLLFSTLADLYAECKTDALCDTYLWWDLLSQDLL